MQRKNKISVQTEEREIIRNAGLILGFILVLTAFFLLFLACRYFFLGFHDVDLVFNYQQQSLFLNPILNTINLSLPNINNATDTGTNYVPTTLSNVYMTGINQELLGFVLMFFSGIFFAFGLYLMIFYRRRDEK